MQLKDSNCEHPGPRRGRAAFMEMMDWSRKKLGKNMRFESRWAESKGSRG